MHKVTSSQAQNWSLVSAHCGSLSPTPTSGHLLPHPAHQEPHPAALGALVAQTCGARGSLGAWQF